MNPGYKDIEKLIVANNSLKSLQGLENSWLQYNGPVLLDVRNNILTQVYTNFYYLKHMYYLVVGYNGS